MVVGTVSAPTPPPAGLAAAGAGASGFERVFEAYDGPGNRMKARAAFEAVNPDADLIDRMVERAESWRQSARPGSRRMPLERWISGERYLERDRLPEVVKETPKVARSTAAVYSPPAPASHDEDHNDVSWMYDL